MSLPAAAVSALPAIAFAGLAALVCLIALLLVRVASGFTRANAPLFAGFAAGMVIAVSILHLMPEALAMTEGAPVLILLGFAFGFVLQRGIEAGAAMRGIGAERRVRLLAIAPVIAIAAHSMVDGAVYAVSFSIDAFLGIQAVAGLIVHEFPETVICFVLLQRAGLSDRGAAIGAFAAAGLTTLGAASLAAPFTAQLDEATLGDMFAVVAGLLLHVGAAHLLAQAGDRGWALGAPAVVAGGVAAFAMSALHDHEGHGHGAHEHGAHEHGEHGSPHAGGAHDDRHDHASEPRHIDDLRLVRVDPDAPEEGEPQ